MSLHIRSLSASRESPLADLPGRSPTGTGNPPPWGVYVWAEDTLSPCDLPPTAPKCREPKSRKNRDSRQSREGLRTRKHRLVGLRVEIDVRKTHVYTLRMQKVKTLFERSAE